MPGQHPGFPGGSAVKNLPVVQETQETQAGFLGQEDPLEDGMATHSSILAWRIPWTEEPGRLQSMGSQRVRHSRSDLACTHASFDNQKHLQTVPNVPRGEEMGEFTPSCELLLRYNAAFVGYGRGFVLCSQQDLSFQTRD